MPGPILKIYRVERQFYNRGDVKAAVVIASNPEFARQIMFEKYNRCISNWLEAKYAEIGFARSHEKAGVVLVEYHLF